MSWPKSKEQIISEGAYSFQTSPSSSELLINLVFFYSQDSDLAQGSPRPPAPNTAPRPPSAPCSEDTHSGLREIGCGPWEPPPHWPGASLPPPHTHLQRGSRHLGSHVHLCFPPSPSPGRRAAILRGEFSGTSHCAAAHLHETCPAEELPSPAGEAVAGGTQAGSVAWWLGTRA